MRLSSFFLLRNLAVTDFSLIFACGFADMAQLVEQRIRNA
jgi:hypothetical protein